jgi:serine protease Do
MPHDTSLQRLSLWVMAASLSVVFAIYGVPQIAHRVTLAVERGRADAADIQLRKLGDTSEVFRLVARRVAPAVVNVSNLGVSDRRALRLDRAGSWILDVEPRLQWQGQGSGFVIDTTGHVVTNRHVVQGAKLVRVRFPNGNERQARIVGSDEHTDLALLHVQGDSFVAVDFGESDKIEVGDWVLAVGNPFGLEQSVTAGIISAKGRSGVVEQLDVQDFLQTDAAINPGNSGGPLVDLKGQVIGVNSAIWSRSGGHEGVSFAIPSKIAQSVVQQLIATGKVTRGWLGVRPEQPGSRKSGSAGVRIKEVLADSPAAKAGINSGDIIVSVDGRRIQAFDELRSRIIASSVGASLRVGIERDGEQRELTVVVGEQPAGLAWLEDQFGISIMDVDSAIAGKFSLPRERGVLVIRVIPELAADQAGIRTGDMIVSVNKGDVESVSEFFSELRHAEVSKGILLGVMDPRGTHRIVVLSP